MAITTLSLDHFLETTNEPTITPLPLVHSTSTANLGRIINSRSIEPTPCNAFRDGSYAYFFVGRPAYRSKDVSDPSYWQLPTVFVIDFDENFPIERAHPFDTGAFLAQPSTLPDYISMFEVADFQIKNIKKIAKFIGAVYGDNAKYFERRPNSVEDMKTRYSFVYKHQKVEAVVRLCGEKNKSTMDDRAATIEIQTKDKIRISSKNLRGIVLPSEVLRDKDIKEAVGLFNCIVKSYDQQSLSLREYYSEIYSKCKEIHRQVGVL